MSVCGYVQVLPEARGIPRAGVRGIHKLPDVGDRNWIQALPENREQEALLRPLGHLFSPSPIIL